MARIRILVMRKDVTNSDDTSGSATNAAATAEGDIGWRGAHAGLPNRPYGRTARTTASSTKVKMML